VLIILIDDLGFGASSAFGGPRLTPNFEKLGVNGLKNNPFHTTALSSPKRKALLTGRNTIRPPRDPLRLRMSAIM
jgi:arylsulfatase A-like enzyme